MDTHLMYCLLSSVIKVSFKLKVDMTTTDNKWGIREEEEVVVVQSPKFSIRKGTEEIHKEP